MPAAGYSRKPVEDVLGAYCEQKVPVHVRDRVRVGYKICGNRVTLFEQRPAFGYPDVWVTIEVAQFRFDSKAGNWILYWADRNSRWHVYDDLDPSSDLEVLLLEVDEDATGIFWG